MSYDFRYKGVDVHETGHRESYGYNHDKRPRGRGWWAFKVDSPRQEQEVIVWFPDWDRRNDDDYREELRAEGNLSGMAYSEARKRACKWALENGYKVLVALS